MDSFRLPRGQRLLIDNVEYIVEGTLAEGRLLLKTAANDDALISTYDDVRRWLNDGRLILRADDGSLPQPQQALLRVDFDSIPEEWRAEAERRYSYIRAVYEAGVQVRTKASLAPIISATSGRIADSKPPSWITLYRWIRSFEAAGMDIRGCIPGFAYRGSNEWRVPTEAREIVDACIEQYWLPPARCSVALTWRYAIDRIAKANLNRAPGDKLILVSEKYVHRRVAQLDAYTRDSRNLGEKAARLKYKPVKEGFTAHRPNDVIEIDHARVDMTVVDSRSGTVLGSPWLTVALDRATRMIVGFHISFHPPSYNSVALCLKSAILSKDYLRSDYPQVEGEWPCWGNICMIVVDRGSDFTSKHLKEACRLLQINIEWTERRTPWHKGKVERFFRTISEDLFQTMTGGLVPLAKRHEGEKPSKKARITLSGLRLLVHMWIIDYYSAKPHAGLKGRSPAQVWRELTSVHQISPFRSREDINVLLRETASATITNRGIRYEGLRYQSDLLTALRVRPGGSSAVTIKLDEVADHIFVQDPLEGRYFKVPVAKEFASYAANLTWYQHEVIARASRDEVKAGAVPISVLAAVRARIQAEAERLRWKPSLRTKMKLARYQSLPEGNCGYWIPPPMPSQGDPEQAQILLPKPQPAAPSDEPATPDIDEFETYVGSQNWRVRAP